MKSQKSDLSVLFISGHPRSGTNLMNRCLDGHPAIFAAPGVGKTNLMRRLASFDWIGMQRGDVVDAIVENVELKKKVVDKAEVGRDPEYLADLREVLEEDLPHEGPYTYRIVKNALVQALARLEGVNIEGKEWFVEKNHNLEFYFERAKKRMPGCKLIFMRRDPLPTFASWKKKTERESLDRSESQAFLNLQKHLVEEIDEAMIAVGQADAVAAVSERYGIEADELASLFSEYQSTGRQDSLLREAKVGWARLEQARTSFASAAALNMLHMRERVSALVERFGDAVMVVQYEELVSHPEDTLKRCADFLDIEYRSILLRPSQNREDWTGNSSWDHGGGIYTASLNKLDIITSDERAVIEGILSRPTGAGS